MFTFQHTARRSIQVRAQAGVIIEPPERGPGKDHESSPRRAQSLKLTDRRAAIRWQPPVPPLMLQERDGVPACEGFSFPPLGLVYQYEAAPGGDQTGNLLCGSAQPSHPTV